MKTLNQIAKEQPDLYTRMALEANKTGKRLIVDDTDCLCLIDCPEKTTEEKAALIREKRDDLLRQTDKYMLPDFPVSPEKRDEYKSYRQRLRDITKQPHFPNIVEFPTVV